MTDASLDEIVNLIGERIVDNISDWEGNISSETHQQVAQELSRQMDNITIEVLVAFLAGQFN